MTNADRSKILEWAESHGLKNLEEKIKTAEALESRSTHIMTALLAAIGGSLAFAVKLFAGEKASPIIFASAWLCGYLILVALFFGATVMRTRRIPAVYSEPENLTDHEAQPLDDIRAGLLDDIQKRINEAALRNDTTARWINAAILAMILSPFVFILAALYRIASGGAT